VNTAGSYSATCTNSCGTSIGSNQIVITQGTTPNAPTVTSVKTLLCNGESTTLTATGCSGNVTWSNTSTGTSLIVNTAGSYSATCTNSCGTSTNSNQIVITQNSTPTTPSASTNKTIVCDMDRAILTASGCIGTVVWSNGASGSTTSVTVAGTYTARCTNECGTSGSSSGLIIKVGVSPTTPSISLANPINCGDASAVLVASNCNGTLNWGGGITGVSTRTVTTSGTYSVVCETICGVSVAGSINVQFKQIPAATASNTGPYTLGQTIQLNATGGGSYSWTGPSNFTATGASPTLIASTNANAGVYTVTVTNTDGCSATATTNVSLSGCDVCFNLVTAEALDSKGLFQLKNGTQFYEISDPTETGVVITLSPNLNAITESLHIVTSGGISFERTENIQPYASFENRGIWIFGVHFSPGTYTIAITGYSQDNLQGVITIPTYSITFTVLPRPNDLSITLTNQLPPKVCADSKITVSFNATGIFGSGNEFEVQLFKNDGTYSSAVVLARTPTTGTLQIQLPSDLESGASYRLRVVSTNAILASLVSNLFIIGTTNLTLVSPTDDVNTIVNDKIGGKITATNLVNPEGKVNYLAEKSVLLNPGFEAKTGSTFQAIISGCNQ
jgi:hypothetical protein